jgi:3-hydroxy-9,10-secoandrosta-1,3,5(10)-triene-9,17-dione monooxygenase
VEIPVPEPELSPEEMIERARALRPWLREEQAETEERGRYSDEIHAEFVKAGFYRCLQPRRYGGYEFDVGTYTRLVQELSTGCPSSGWGLCLAAGHALMLGSYFSEEAQSEAFGPDGDFRAASVGAPSGTASPVDGGWQINGTWAYCSGAPFSNYFMPTVLVTKDGQEPRAGIGLIPESQWTMLDDWGAILGMRGSGSNSIAVEETVVPPQFVAEVDMLDVDVSDGTPGSRLHGNSMYAGRCMLYFHAEIVSIMIGAARAALDEYEEIIRTRTTLFPPIVPRYTHHDFQRALGLGMGMVRAAEAVVANSAEKYMQLCRRGFEGGEPYSLEEDLLMFAGLEHAGRLVWEAVETLFRTAGSTAAKDGQRMQRYYRDLGIYRGHLSAQYEAIAERLGRVHLGLEEGFVRNSDPDAAAAWDRSAAS